MDEMLAGIAESVERLSATTRVLEQMVGRLVQGQAELAAAADETVGRITATVESREAELERKLAEAEATIVELRASGGRKTSVAGSLVAKAAEVSEMGALDGALASLSVEQRFAVKAEMLRSGLLR